ncbi:MAG: hypothetical protein HPY67_00220 [Syntrophaceae bacterium]|nr:hypothetical protein [Syntrophaceae bacterium]
MNAFFRVTLNKFKLIASLIAIGHFLCSPADVSAAPAITGVAGIVGNGETITITGTGFGSTGPTIVVFDDFERGSNGTTLSSVQRAAQVGFWDNLSTMGPLYPTYSNTYAHSGSLSMKSDWSDNGAQEGGRLVQATLDSVTQVYFSWWQYLPTNRVVPGTSGGAGANWKLYWLYRQPWPNDDFVSVILTNTLPVTVGGSGLFLTGFADDSQDGRIDINNQSGSTVTAFSKGQWHRFEAYYVAGGTSGSLTLWELNSTQSRRQLGTNSGKTTDFGGTWDKLHFPGYGRGDNNSQTYYDDIYVATGTGARARVEIGNSSIYSNCTNLAVITPTSWSSNSITATVRQGGFAAGFPAYLFVIDSTGAASAGYPVTIGSGGPAPAPAAVSPPSGLRIVTN